MTTDPNKDVPPDTTAEISKDGIKFLRQARLFSDEPVEVEQFSWNEIHDGKVTIDDISDLTTENGESSGFSATLQGARVSFGGQTEPKITQEPLPNIASAEEIWADLEEKYDIQYDHESNEIEFDGSESDKENYLRFFVYLSDKSLLSRLNIPYKTETAKNYTLNNVPELREGKEMARPAKVAEEVWLETQIPKEQKKTNMIRIVNKVAGGNG